MLRIIRSGPVWQGDANGHVLDGRFFREFRRNGADTVELSSEQWKGVFGGAPEPTVPMVDGLKVRLNNTLAPDEIRFYDEGALIGVIKRLYVIPTRKER